MIRVAYTSIPNASTNEKSILSVYLMTHVETCKTEYLAL